MYGIEAPAAQTSHSLLPPATPVSRRRFFIGPDAAVYFVRQNAARFRRHRHRRLQIVLWFDTARGTAMWLAPNGTWIRQPFEGAHVWIIPANMLHAVSLETKTVMVVIDVEPGYLRQITIERLQHASLEPMSGYVQADQVIASLTGTFVGYCRGEKMPGRRCVVNDGATLAHHVVAAHVASRHHVRSLRRGLPPSAFASAQRKIEDRMVEGVDFAELARTARLSRGHFTRMFKLSAGCTPEHYLNNLRTKKALELLRSGQFASITEVAHAIGCYDHSHLGKLMRKRYELPPSAFFQKKVEQ